MNKCFITGRIATNLELRCTTTGKSICDFRIATNRPVVRDGKREADFISCVVWNKQAENLVKYQRKGNLIGIQGEFRTDIYEVKGEKKYKSYVLVNELEFLDSKKDNPVDNKEYKDISVKTPRQESIEITDNDLPW